MFSDPWLFLLSLVVLAVLILRWVPPFRRHRDIPFSGYGWLPPADSWSGRVAKANLLLKALALTCLIPIAAGIKSAGAPGQAPPSALVIVLDVSSSMTADDFRPTNRLDEAKRRLEEFIDSSRGVEMGLILFALSPRLVVPVTPDAALLSTALRNVQPAGLDEDGTAIGSGIASAVNRLRAGPWRVRRILLITDGVSNRGSLAPLDAARLARLFSIRIDAIGIGTEKVSRFWVPNSSGSQTEVEARIDIDDKSLESVAAETGGRYERVRNSGELNRALTSLDSTSRVPTTGKPAEREGIWTRLLALVSLSLAILTLLISDLAYSLLPE